MNRDGRFLAAWGVVFGRPGFVCLGALTLAVGVAVLTSALTLADALLWRPPPFAASQRVAVYGSLQPGEPMPAISPALEKAMADLPGVLTRGTTRLPAAVNVVLDERRWLLRGQRVDAGFMETLGVVPVLGKNLAGAGDVMVSYEFWREHMDGRSGAIDRSLVVDGQSLHVRGVLPEGYRFLDNVDVVLPLGDTSGPDATAENLVALARLAPGAGIAALASAVDQRVARDACKTRRGIAAARGGAVALEALLTCRARPAILGFIGIAGMVLAVAGVNLCNLMLGRQLVGARDRAIRMVLGAHRTAACSPALADAVAVGVLAALIGIPSGSYLVDVFRDAVPHAWLSSSLPVETTWRACGLAVVADALVVLLAATAASVHDGGQDLLHNGRELMPRVALRSRAAIILLQTALAGFLMVVGVAAVMRFLRLETVPPGFDAGAATFTELHLDADDYRSRDDVVRLLDSLRAAPRDARARGPIGFTMLLPLGESFVMPFLDTLGRRRFVQYALMTPGAAEAMGLRKRSGRWFDEGDRAGAAPVGLVNRTFLETMGAHADGTVRSASRIATTLPLRIVGVVEDTRAEGTGERAVATVFIPLAQVQPSIFDFARRLAPMYAVMRGPSASITNNRDVLAGLLREFAPTVAPSVTLPLAGLVTAARADVRRNAALLATLAMAAQFLAAVGMYSAQSVDVTARRRELALRSALGARRSQLVYAANTSHVVLAVVGTATGLAGGLVIRPWTSASTIDVSVVVIAAAFFLVTMLGASAIPAWRAATVSPLQVLRGG